MNARHVDSVKMHTSAILNFGAAGAAGGAEKSNVAAAPPTPGS